MPSSKFMHPVNLTCAESAGDVWDAHAPPAKLVDRTSYLRDPSSVPFGIIIVISPAGQSGAALIVLDNLNEFLQLGQFLVRVLRGLYRLCGLYSFFFHSEDLLSNIEFPFLGRYNIRHKQLFLSRYDTDILEEGIQSREKLVEKRCQGLPTGTGRSIHRPGADRKRLILRGVPHGTL